MNQWISGRACLLLLSLALLGLSACGSSKRIEGYVAPEAAASDFGYLLPTKRPGDELKAYLEEQLMVQPDNWVYHRDLGCLYQSRTTLVAPPLRWEYVRKATAHLARADELNPGDPQTLAYLGLARAASAKGPDVALFAKMRVAQEGFRLLDEAVALLPENYSLRVIRATAGSLAPGFLGRQTAVAEDVALIRKGLEERQDMPVHLRTFALIFMGDYYSIENKQKAREYWKQAEAMDSHFAVEATQRLEGTYLGW